MEDKFAEKPHEADPSTGPTDADILPGETSAAGGTPSDEVLRDESQPDRGGDSKRATASLETDRPADTPRDAWRKRLTEYKVSELDKPDAFSACLATVTADLLRGRCFLRWRDQRSSGGLLRDAGRSKAGRAGRQQLFASDPPNRPFPAA
jgi:hypothetical protein